MTFNIIKIIHYVAFNGGIEQYEIFIMRTIFYLLFPYGRFITLNVFMLLATSIIAVSFIKNKKLKLVLAALASLFTVLQLSSLYISQSFIGYSFIIHFNMRDFLAMVDNFITQTFILLIVFSLITVLVYYWSDLWNMIRGKVPFINRHLLKIPQTVKAMTKILGLAFCLYFMNLQNGVVNKSLDIISMSQVKGKGFDEAISGLGMTQYTQPNQLMVQPGKNIIVIFLESYEAGYLSKKFAALTPNMRSIREKWTYFPMRQTPGSEWSSGSLYTCLTGFPSFFNAAINREFPSTNYSHITGISQILDQAGYDLTYIIKDGQFAGTQDLLHAFSFNEIIDQSIFGSDAHDKDLFKRAKIEIQRKLENGKHFALFLSTIDTHFPTGNYDERMEGLVAPQASDLEFMVAAVDYMIGDFIDFLNNEQILSNTTLFIFPDHLKMGNPSIFEGTGERMLYMITNAKKQLFSYEKSDTLFQIDMPKLILEGASIRHNAKFLTDYITGDKIKFIRESKFLITALNVAGLNRIHQNNYFRIPVKTDYFPKYAIDTARFIAHAGGMIDGHTYTNSLEALDLNYANGFRLFELDIIKTSDGHFVAAHDWSSWSKISDYHGNLPVTKAEFLNYKLLGRYSPMDMDRINQWFRSHQDAILVTDKVNEPKNFSDLFIDKDRLMMELFSLKAVKEGLAAGIKSAMPSQNVIKSLKGNKVDALIELGVNAVAVSRSDIPEDYDFFKSLKQKGIKAYAFHINFDRGKDEKYVVTYEMDYIYGIYADKWNFSNMQEITYPLN